MVQGHFQKKDFHTFLTFLAQFTSSVLLHCVFTVVSCRYFPTPVKMNPWEFFFSGVSCWIMIELVVVERDMHSSSPTEPCRSEHGMFSRCPILDYHWSVLYINCVAIRALMWACVDYLHITVDNVIAIYNHKKNCQFLFNLVFRLWDDNAV